MSLFRQLIDIGEDTPAQEAPTNELDSLSKTELVERLGRANAAVQEKEVQFTALRGEAQSLRAEYDAYRLKVEQWQVQMKEARARDNKLIEELRAASGSGGSTDELFVRSLQETVDKYKEELRAANDEIGREKKRRAEGEEARRVLEEGKQRDVEDACARFDTIRETLQQGQRRLEEELRAANARTETAVANVAARDRKVSELQGRVRALEAAESPTSAEGDAPAPSDSAAKAAVAASEEQLASVTAQLEQQRAAHEAALTELRGQRDEAERRVQDAALQSAEGERRLAEARATTAAVKDELQAVLDRQERSANTAQLAERSAKSETDTLRQEVVTEKERALTAARDHEVALEALRTELREARARIAQRSELQAGAEEASTRAAEAFGAERRQYESQLTAVQRQCLELSSQREQAEASLGECREALHHRDAVVDELRAELGDEAQRAGTLEAQLLALHRVAATSQDGDAVREQERHTLRRELDAELSVTARLRDQLRDAHGREAEALERLGDAEAAARQARNDADAVRQELQDARGNLRGDAAGRTEAEQRIAGLERRLASQSDTTAEAVRVREDQSAKVRQLEVKLRDAEAQLQITRSALAESGGAPQRASNPSAVLSSAFPTGARLTWSQSKTIIAGSVAFLLMLGLVNSFVSPPVRNHDVDTVITMKEKYTQALTAAAKCQESLAERSADRADKKK